MSDQIRAINSIATLQSIADSRGEDGIDLELDGQHAFLMQSYIEGDKRLYSWVVQDGAKTFNRVLNEDFALFLEQANIKELLKKHASGDSQQEISQRKKHASGDSKVTIAFEKNIKGILVTPREELLQGALRALRVRGKSMLRVTTSGAISNRYKKLRFCLDCIPDVDIAGCHIHFIDQSNSLDESEELFGKICFNCKAPLAEWSQCSFCRNVWWDGCESHMCDELRAKLRRDPEYLSFDSGLVETFHTNPIPD